MEIETIEQFVTRKHTWQSARTYLYNINHYLAVNPGAEKYGHKEVVNYMAELKTRYTNTSTRSAILSGIKRYYDYLVETKQRNDHPCRFIRLKGETKGKKRQMQFQDLFSPEELQSLLNRDVRYENLRLRNKIIISLLIYQALTCDDIIRIDIDNVDLDKMEIYIKSSAKLNSRTLKLQQNQKEYIEAYLKTYRKLLLKTASNRLIIGFRGDPETVEGIGGMLEPLKALFPERPFNAKTIRSSVMSNWFNVNKYRLEDVQIWAGHKWPSSTLKYKRLDIAEQREKINKWHPLK